MVFFVVSVEGFRNRLRVYLVTEGLLGVSHVGNKPL